jgi:hypothetical protein
MMPPLLSPSPIIIDHSFPRNTNEVHRAAVALGELAELLDRGEAEILITEALRDFVDLFDCGAGERPYAILQDLHALLDTWILTMPNGVVRVAVDDLPAITPHPIPANCSDEGLVDFWAVELGKLLVAHDAECDNGNYFIGVACESAFSGGPLQRYRTETQRAFPLIGPNNLSTLDDADVWEVLPGIHTMEVSFDQAKRNIHLIGATEVRPPRSGSHYMVNFPEALRPWPLDRNVDPIAERFLKQLIPLSGYPLAVIKSTLISGRPPQTRRRLAERIR